MPDANDMELLRDYSRDGSEPAFAELVQRHIGLVYSVALRQVGIAAHAEEITQAVFIILARKAGRLRPDTILEGWLHETTRMTALSFLRGERRRQFREQKAYMQSTLQESADDAVWHQLSPLLDEAISRLGKTDRDAVMLRFFKDKSLREVAAALKVNESAAQRRVLRALEKLHRFFSRRGISSTTAIIAGAISANSVQAAPVALAKSVTTLAMAKGAAASSSTLTLIKGALKVMAWTKAKTAAVAVAGVIVATGTTSLVVHHQHQQRPLPKPQPVAPTETDFPKTSWTFAGYTDPQSAFLSAIWFDHKGDFETFLASLTPGERERQLQQYKGMAQKMGKSLAACFIIASTEGLNKAEGFQILDQQVIADDQVILHVSFRGTLPGEKQEIVKVVDVKMIKTGNEWKIDSIGPK
ncbi:MAG TPA: sigma-70 family RNA polymerase sigma factor [Verrucomicrobiae bacterium]|nr:sigma-70 family RNA polymerase sigma factor [Verrucomicrobiae bacterium]